MRTSVRSNSTAYGYSVAITASFGVLVALVGDPAAGEIFVFVAGAPTAFALVEVVASKGFRATGHLEPQRVVFLASAFNFFSIGAAVGAAALVGRLVGGWPAWVLGSFSATIVYLVVVGCELALAERLEE